MSSISLCRLLRAAVIAVAVCGLFICGYILPNWLIGAFREHYGPLGGYLWLAFIWAASLPCFAILVLVWRVSTAVKHDEVFSVKTARLVKTGAILLFWDTGFFFAGNVVLWLASLNHPGVLLLSLFVDIFGVSLALLAAVLSRYITKAAALQEEADGTI